MLIKEHGRLVLRVVEDADVRVHQGADQHAVVVLELERVEDAELVEELPAQVLSTHTHEANVSTCIGRARDTRAVCKRSCVHGLRARSPEDDGHRAARRDGTPVHKGGRRQTSARACACTAGTRTRSGSAQDSRHQSVLGPKSGQRAC